MTRKLKQIKEPVKLRRPQYLSDAGRGEAASFVTQPGDANVKLLGTVASSGIPDNGQGEGDPDNGQAKAASLKSMLATLADLEKYVPLSDVTGIPEQEGAEPPEPGDLLGLEPPPRGRNQYRGMTPKAAQDAVLKEVTLELMSTSKPEMERALLQIQKGILADLGDAAFSQMAVLLVNSTVRLERLEHVFFSACARVGLIKINRSSRTVSVQPALERGLLPVIQAKRLLLAALDALRKQGTQTRRMSMTFDGDDLHSEEEVWAHANEMNLILSGTPLKPLGTLKKMVLEQTQTIKR